MANEIYLVTGATGYTGKFTTEELLRNGKKVRAFVHQIDARSKALEQKGAEIFVGDLYDFMSVRESVEGITAVYFNLTIATELIPMTAFFAQAAREAKLKAIVNMSQISSRREASSHTAFNHWIAEQVFNWSGNPVVHLRPTFFAEWLLYPFTSEQIKKGLVEWGFSTGKHAPIAAEDQGRFIAKILQNPDPHIGKIYPLYGPKEYTSDELYAEVSRVLGREIKYKSLSEEAFKEKLSGIKPLLAQHFLEVAKDHTNGIFAGTDHIIKEITGKAPMGLAEFVEQNRKTFEI